MVTRKWVGFVILFLIGNVFGGDVSYDHRSLIINGERKILFSGSIHYPRSTPEMWPALISKAKDGGIDVIDTYVFWNIHEPEPGQFDFSGRRDLVGFIKEVQAQGLYACLRIGPFIQAEWSYGGLPFWLREIPGIVFRTNNEPFKAHMQNFTSKIVSMMQSERLYASQGGPIILSQIENEYSLVEQHYREDGRRYIKWAAQMAVGLQTGVPWVMCRQEDAPDPVINTCNGMRCGETFSGPNSPNKPSIWTENWTTRYEVYGVEKPKRPVEDLAFHVALFIAAKNGSFVNYYMYHGGTNFGRVASAFTTTSYYDEAPIDEYGLIRQPKWGHLKELHAAIKLCSAILLHGTQSDISLGRLQQAYIFSGQAGECVAFLINNDSTNGVTLNFRNSSYDLPPKSISILPDCKNVAFNTAKVSTQSNTRTMAKDKVLASPDTWSEFQETIPNFDDTTIRYGEIRDQIITTKDTSDYLWYTMRYANNDSKVPKLLMNSRGHILRAFVNGQFIGSAQGSFEYPRFSFNTTLSSSNGVYNISLLSVMVGMPDSGANLESKTSGLETVLINDANFTTYSWGYQIGLQGETLQIYTDQGSSQAQWRKFSNAGVPLTWYKTNFDAPLTDVPTALNLGSMKKGEAWVNGQSIGRYWPSYRCPNGSAKIWYNIPPSFLKPKGNVLVLFEEEGGDPLQISLDTISITQICGHVAASDLNGGHPKVELSCTMNKEMSHIAFASYGTPMGSCGTTYGVGQCHSRFSTSMVEKACLGKMNCTIPMSNQYFGGDPCPTKPKSLLVVAECK